MSEPRQLRFSQTTASVLLDATRGVAAFLVLLEHWRNAFFVDFPQIQRYRTLLAPLYLLCAVGHQAVIVFFVLSGYLVGGSVLRDFGRGEWSWRRYLTHRLVRLWLVLLPALALGAGWDWLGIRLHLAPALYAGANYNHMTPDVGQALSWKAFLDNATFLQTIAVPALGSNGALWSLANEFWYYMLFPLAACLLGRIYKRPLLIMLSGFSFVTAAVLVTKEIWLLFPVWLLGALLHILPRKPTSALLRGAGTFAYVTVFFGIALLQRQKRLGTGVAADLLLGVVTAAFLWMLLGAMQPAKAGVGSLLARATARFSFTLYVTHTPVLVFLVALTAHDTRWVPSPKAVCIAFGLLVAIAGSAWLMAMATEFRTERVRAWVEAKILPRAGVDPKPV